VAKLRIPSIVTGFGEAIRWARNERKMTLRALATTVGVTPPFQSDLEHGRRETARVAEYAKALNVELSDLECRQGVTEDLTEWLKKNPKIVKLLRDIRACRCSPLVLDGPHGRKRPIHG
jgi:transcriptional regulator with XRE-family HTH domain